MTFTTAGWRKMVARLGVAAELGFKAHPHMFRHACGFQLANQGTDTRAPCKPTSAIATSSTPCATPNCDSGRCSITCGTAGRRETEVVQAIGTRALALVECPILLREGPLSGRIARSPKTGRVSRRSTNTSGSVERARVPRPRPLRFDQVPLSGYR